MTVFRQKIIKLGTGKYRVFWENYENQTLILDFNPIIRYFALKETYPCFVLLHWQARPRGLRRWGLYDSLSDQYYGADYDKVTIASATAWRLLQIDERVCSSIPTALVCYPYAKVTAQGNELTVIGDLANE